MHARLTTQQEVTLNLNATVLRLNTFLDNLRSGMASSFSIEKLSIAFPCRHLCITDMQDVWLDTNSSVLTCFGRFDVFLSEVIVIDALLLVLGIVSSQPERYWEVLRGFIRTVTDTLKCTRWNTYMMMLLHDVTLCYVAIERCYGASYVPSPILSSVHGEIHIWCCCYMMSHYVTLIFFNAFLCCRCFERKFFFIWYYIVYT